jgi:hypothetical protein
MLKFFITFLCFSFGLTVNAQDSDAYLDSTLIDTDIPKNDEPYTMDTTLTQYSFITNDDSVRNYGTGKNFPYMRNLDSALKVIGKIPIDTVDLDGSATPSKPARERQIRSVSTFSVSPFLRFILWVAAIAFLLFIIYRLFAKGNVFNAATAKTKTVKAEEQVSVNGDYDRLISQAITHNNFRLATRYLYLKTLYILSAANLITISPDKTNYQYVREMSNHTFYKDFVSLTSNYEYVWYGKFDIDKTLFERIEKEFKNYFQRL